MQGTIMVGMAIIIMIGIASVVMLVTMIVFIGVRARGDGKEPGTNSVNSL